MTNESKEQWWMKEWEERFAENYVYWQEIRQEALVGDPDLKSLVAFIQKTVTEAFSRGKAEGKVDGLKMAIDKAKSFIEVYKQLCIDEKHHPYESNGCPMVYARESYEGFIDDLQALIQESKR